MWVHSAQCSETVVEPEILAEMELYDSSAMMGEYRYGLTVAGANDPYLRISKHLMM